MAAVVVFYAGLVAALLGVLPLVIKLKDVDPAVTGPLQFNSDTLSRRRYNNPR